MQGYSCTSLYVLSTNLLVCLSTRDWLSGVLVLLLLCIVEFQFMGILEKRPTV